MVKKRNKNNELIFRFHKYPSSIVIMNMRPSYSFIYGAGVEPSPLLLGPFIGLYQLWMIDGDDCGAIKGMNEWQGKPKYSENNHPGADLITKVPTRHGPGSKPGRLGGKPATNGLSYATAHNTTPGRGNGMFRNDILWNTQRAG
jgi:hypothetical protein